MRLRSWAVLLAAVLGAGAVVVVVVATTTGSACDGVTFHAAGPAPAAAAERSPLKLGGAREAIRSAFRGPGQAAYCHDFADPYVLHAGGHYTAFATNNQDGHVPALVATSSIRAAKPYDALPNLPVWSSSGSVWAPSVVPRGAGYVMYYATRVTKTGQECLSTAFGRSATGTFVDNSTQPWVCPHGGGAIDPSPFVAPDGKAYLVWKNWGSTPAGIVAAPLTSDGLHLAGAPTLLLTPDQSWEGGVVEGPSMAMFGRELLLFYSANDWRTARYAIGYARCSGPLGPCAKPRGPWIASTRGAEGPGGPETYLDNEHHPWLVFHAWAGKAGYPDGARSLFTAPLSIDSRGRPTIG